MADASADPNDTVHWQHEVTGHDFRWHLFVRGVRLGCLISSYKTPGRWMVWRPGERFHSNGIWERGGFTEESAKAKLLELLKDDLPQYDPGALASELKELEAMYGLDSGDLIPCQP